MDKSEAEQRGELLRSRVIRVARRLSFPRQISFVNPFAPRMEVIQLDDVERNLLQQKDSKRMDHFQITECDNYMTEYRVR